MIEETIIQMINGSEILWLVGLVLLYISYMFVRVSLKWLPYSLQPVTDDIHKYFSNVVLFLFFMITFLIVMYNDTPGFMSEIQVFGLQGVFINASYLCLFASTIFFTIAGGLSGDNKKLVIGFVSLASVIIVGIAILLIFNSNQANRDINFNQDIVTISVYPFKIEKCTDTEKNISINITNMLNKKISIESVRISYGDPSGQNPKFFFNNLILDVNQSILLTTENYDEYGITKGPFALNVCILDTTKAFVEVSTSEGNVFYKFKSPEFLK